MNKVRFTFIASLLFSSLSLQAIAEEPFSAPATPTEQAPKTSEHTLNWNIGLVNDYVFRGLTQTNGKPAIQGGIDYSHTSGFYAGTWLSNISWYAEQNAGTVSTPAALSSPGSAGTPYLANQHNSTSLEWDIYGGYKKTLANNWTVDLGLIQYYYPGTYNSLGAYQKPNTTEAYAGINYKWLTFKYSKAISQNTFGANDSKGAQYFDLSSSIPIQNSGFTLITHIGRQLYPDNPNILYWGNTGGNNGYYSYTDYKVGVTKDYLGTTFGVAWTYANTHPTGPDQQTTAYFNAYGENIGRNHFVFSISKTFE